MKHFKPLVIPKALQNALPYKDKPKMGPINGKGPIDSNRIAVIHSPHEQKIEAMLKMIRTNYKAKKEKDRADTDKRVSRFKAEKNAIELRRLKKQKELKKKICRTISRMDKSSKEKTGEGTGGFRGRKSGHKR